MLDQMIYLLFANPGFPESGKMYDSGIKEVEHSYESDRPATDYPMLTLEIMMQDLEYKVIKPGIYSVDLRPDLKMLLILEGNKVVAKCPVVQVIELEQEVVVPSVKVGFVRDNVVFILYKKGNIEAQGILYKYIIE